MSNPTTASFVRTANAIVDSAKARGMCDEELIQLDMLFVYMLNNFGDDEVAATMAKFAEEYGVSNTNDI